MTMNSVVIPHPPAMPPMGGKPPSASPPFRLLTDDAEGDTGSVYSIYKQKIDSMFESDSTVSSTNPNSVQVRIERMFTDVMDKETPGLPQTGGTAFSIDYLGSVCLSEKVTSLAGLQNPLKELYFAYKRVTKGRKTLTGRLEISRLGLRVQYQGEKGDLEQMNSFPTIAVWSAVKFVIQNEESYAFLPLITDPDNIDKKALFRRLTVQEQKYITKEAHSPLFAVVMRKIGVQKQLECHGFVCQTSEDAIVIAATLYKSLMAHMKAKEKTPKSRNGITCMSIASSNFNEKNSNITPIRPPRKKRSTTSSTISDMDHLEMCDTQPLLMKSPKKSVKTRRAPKAPDDIDAILPYEEPTFPRPPSPKEIKPKTFSDQINTYMSREQKQITAEIKQVMSEGSNRGLKHVPPKKAVKEEVLPKDNSGDILTKVTIPRSGSFLNAGGLTRYKTKVYSNGQASGGSPLGFNELFNEFRLQEGLHSMDEILGVIIDPEGMSFNDLKPIYKEFLLKLSVTLTKDELYQRSKSIMRRHRKKIRNSQNSTAKNTILVGSKFKRLKHIFQKSFKKPKNLPPTSVIQENKLPESSISTSSYDTRHFTPKDPILNHHSNQKQRNKKRDRTSTSEESDFFSVRRSNKQKTDPLLLINNANHNRNSSSGYVSCSECSYDSDTCTCTSADKCYCSLGNTKRNKQLKERNNRNKCQDCHQSNENVTFCGCDTDSCTESNKCYCHTEGKKQVKKGGRRLVETYQPMKHRKLCKKLSNSKSTRSVEYMRNPLEAYYEKIHNTSNNNNNRRRRSLMSEGVDYELFNVGSLRDRAAYATVLSEGIHKHSSLRSYNSGKNTRGPYSEALSVKKSAEIAALFADMKINPPGDIQRTKLDSIISRNAYNRLKTQNAQARADIKAIGQYGPSKLIQNGLYGRNPGNAHNMYNTTNGLYTIQSQSDDSCKSSVCEKSGGSQRKDREYFELEAPTRGVHGNLENSLGYLP